MFHLLVFEPLRTPISRFPQKYLKRSGTSMTTQIPCGLFNWVKQRATMKPGSIPSKMIWTASSYSCVFVSPSLSTTSSCTAIQAGLFSAALTSFLAESVVNLQVDPAQQMVYYQQQNAALLAQISKQVASIAPQISIPSTLPTPYPEFSPQSSAIRVNVYWFMSLVFSLSAALLATLVQQWVRDYMHVFQRYSNPLKSARLRQ